MTQRSWERFFGWTALVCLSLSAFVIIVGVMAIMGSIAASAERQASNQEQRPASSQRSPTARAPRKASLPSRTAATTTPAPLDVASGALIFTYTGAWSGFMIVLGLAGMNALALWRWRRRLRIRAEIRAEGWIHTRKTLAAQP